LFLFSALAPWLVLASVAIVIWIAVDQFRKRHSLFLFERFEPGQMIVRQGEAGDCAYFIQSGEVEILQHNNGKDVRLNVLGKGDYFGEMALLSGQQRSASVRATAPTEVAVLGRENFLTMLRTIPSTRQDVMKTFQERAAKSVRP
jgi:CRP-like cAMP-binding protein